MVKLINKVGGGVFLKSCNLFSILYESIICYICWIAFTLKFTWQELLVGAIISLIAAILTDRLLKHNKQFNFNPKKLFALIYYFLFVLNKEIWVSNLDLAKKSLNPKLKIRPDIIKVPSELDTEGGLLLLANSISSKPGTTVLDIVKENHGNYMYVHCIDVVTTSGIESGEIIKGSLEKNIGRIFND